jgi:hypothetical protein
MANGKIDIGRSGKRVNWERAKWDLAKWEEKLGEMGMGEMVNYFAWRKLGISEEQE